MKAHRPWQGGCLVAVILLALAGVPSVNAAAPVPLTFYYPVAVAGPLAKIVNTYVDEFNKTHPDIVITPVFTGDYDQTRAKIVTALVGGRPPDVAVLLSADLLTMVQMSAIIPLDGFIAKEPKGWADDFQPAFWLNSRADGKTWSIPFQRSSPILFYNKDLFAKAGLDPNRPPRTWDELVTDARRLTVRSPSGEVVQWGVEIPTSSQGATYWLLQGFVLQAGSPFFEPSGRKVYLTSPGAKAALRFWYSLVYTYHVMPPGVLNLVAVPSDFVAQRTAMFFHSTGNLSFVRRDAHFRFGTAFMPKRARYGCPTGGGNLYIFRGVPASHQEVAWTFIEWLTSPERAAKWSMDSGYIATRKSAYGVPEMRTFVTEWPQYLVARDQLAYCQEELMTYANQKVYNIINEAVQHVMTGAQLPDAALSWAQAQVDQALAP